MVARSERGPLAEWWWTVDRPLLVAFLALIATGMVMSFAASPPVAERIGLGPFHFTERHAVFAALGIAILFAASHMPQRVVRRVALVVLVGSLAAMLLTLFIGAEVKGSRRWISVVGFSIQPSEFMKPAFVVICAWLLAQGRRRRDVPGNAMALALLVLIVAMLLAQPDLGQTMLVVATWGLMFFMAGMPWLWVIVLASLAVGTLATAYFVFPHVAGRIDRFLTGEGDNFQVDTATEAIVAGGWLGKGPGEGTVKAILPDSHTDFVFAVMAEEFGIALCLVTVAVFAFVVLRGLVWSLRERDDFTRFAVSGLVMLFGLQAFINMGVNLRVLPAKGMTLPFVSSGGSSMMAMALGMGMVLALTRVRPQRRARAVRPDTLDLHFDARTA